MEKYFLEVCVDSLESADAAMRGGADRLMICSGMVLGGLTPDMSLFYEIKKRIDLETCVLIRPRCGDFCYTDEEFRLMKDGVRLFREAGADAVAVGMLNPDGSLDVPRLDELMLLTGKMKAVLNRCFDFCRDPMEAMEQARMLGMRSILTSGQQSSCLDGRSVIAQLVLNAGDLEVIVGGGVRSTNIGALIKVTGAKGFHMSGAKETDSSMLYRKKGISLGLSEGNPYKILRTDEEEVARVKAILNRSERVI